MGKLAILGATLLGFSGTPAVTARQAERALWNDAKVLPTSQLSCVADGAAQLCTASDSTGYTDAVFGPATIVGTTTFRVSRARHGYRVRIVVPEQFNIYAGPQ